MDRGPEVSNQQNKKLSGYLFMGSGCLFFIAAFFSKQVAFCGVAAMFIALGALYLSIARKA
jgi:hypothetical protein